MLKFVITDCDGNSINTGAPLTVVMNSEADVPADDITVTFAYNKNLFGNADFITAYDDNSVVFNGQIDEITNIKNGNAVITKVTARSRAAFLLDNEAEPVTYVNPATKFIFDRHLKPYGIKADITDEVPFYGSLKIDKGMTQWQVLYNFCKNRYGCTPRITADGQALFEGYKNSKIVEFSDVTGDSVYHSIKEDFKRYKLISDVMIMYDEIGGYRGRIINTDKSCNGINRRRYVNAAADKSTVETADKIIAKSITDSYAVTLECVGCFTEIVGCKAVINDSVLGTIDNMIVSSIKYSLGANGETTMVCVRRNT